MKGRNSWVWRRLYLIAYWRTAEQRAQWSPSCGLSLRLNLHATGNLELGWFVWRHAGVLELGIRYRGAK